MHLVMLKGLCLDQAWQRLGVIVMLKMEKPKRIADQARQAGNEEALLVTGDGPSSRVYLVTLQNKNRLVVPFNWLLGRFKGASLLTSEFEIIKIRKPMFKGFSGPNEVGVPFFSGYYFFLMIFGVLTLSIPVCVELSFGEEKESMRLDKMIDFLEKTILKNPDFYSRRSAKNIVENLKNEDKFSRIARLFE